MSVFKRVLYSLEFLPKILLLVIVVTKSAPDLLKTELRLHVVVYVFAMNLLNAVFVLEFLSVILSRSFVWTQLI